MLRSIVTAVALSLAVGCASPDTPTAFCQRAKDCSDLNPGYGVDDCVGIVNQCLNTLPSDEQEDWQRMAEDCISDDSCQLFTSCYQELPWCN